MDEIQIYKWVVAHALYSVVRTEPQSCVREGDFSTDYGSTFASSSSSVFGSICSCIDLLSCYSGLPSAPNEIVAVAILWRLNWNVFVSTFGVDWLWYMKL